jgi:hypothetical protein
MHRITQNHINSAVAIPVPPILTNHNYSSTHAYAYERSEQHSLTYCRWARRRYQGGAGSGGRSRSWGGSRGRGWAGGRAGPPTTQALGRTCHLVCPVTHPLSLIKSQTIGAGLWVSRAIDALHPVDTSGIKRVLEVSVDLQTAEANQVTNSTAATTGRRGRGRGGRRGRSG